MARITPEHLVAVLTHDALGDSVASEDEVWGYVRDWCVGRRGDEVREVLPHVRFPTLTTETLEQCEEWGGARSHGRGRRRRAPRARRRGAGAEEDTDIDRYRFGFRIRGTVRRTTEDEARHDGGYGFGGGGGGSAVIRGTEVTEAMDDDDEDGSPGRRTARRVPEGEFVAYPPRDSHARVPHGSSVRIASCANAFGAGDGSRDRRLRARLVELAATRRSPRRGHGAVLSFLCAGDGNGLFRYLGGGGLGGGGGGAGPGATFLTPREAAPWT